MCRGNEIGLNNQQEEQGPEWLWDSPKDQRELGRRQGKWGNSMGLERQPEQSHSSLPSWRISIRTYFISKQWSFWRHLKDMAAYLNSVAVIFLRKVIIVSNELRLWGTFCCFLTELENVYSLQRSWKTPVSGISVPGTFGAPLEVAARYPVEGFSMQ